MPLLIFGLLGLIAVVAMLRFSNIGIGAKAPRYLGMAVTGALAVFFAVIERWMPAVFPTVQGRLIGVVRIARLKDGFLIDTERASHDAVLKSISRFTMAGPRSTAPLARAATPAPCSRRGRDE